METDKNIFFIYPCLSVFICGQNILFFEVLNNG